MWPDLQVPDSRYVLYSALVITNDVTNKHIGIQSKQEGYFPAFSAIARSISSMVFVGPEYGMSPFNDSTGRVLGRRSQHPSSRCSSINLSPCFRCRASRNCLGNEISPFRMMVHSILAPFRMNDVSPTYPNHCSPNIAQGQSAPVAIPAAHADKCNAVGLSSML